MSKTPVLDVLGRLSALLVLGGFVAVLNGIGGGVAAAALGVAGGAAWSLGHVTHFLQS